MNTYKLELSEIEIACGVTLEQVQELLPKVLCRNGAVILPKHTGSALCGATARAALASPVKFVGLDSLSHPIYRAEGRTETTWGIGNNGTGKRIYFVLRNDGTEYHTNKNGDMIRYTREGATKKADALNKAEGN